MVNEQALREAFRKIKADMAEMRQEIEKLREEIAYLKKPTKKRRKKK